MYDSLSLTFKGQELADNQKLDEVGVEDGDLIHKNV